MHFRGAEGPFLTVSENPTDQELSSQPVTRVSETRNAAGLLIGERAQKLTVDFARQVHVPASCRQQLWPR